MASSLTSAAPPPSVYDEKPPAQAIVTDIAIAGAVAVASTATSAATSATRALRFVAARYGPDYISDVAGKLEFSAAAPSFSQTLALEDRKTVSQRLRAEYPGYLPIIVERAAGSNLSIQKRSVRVLIPRSMTVAALTAAVRRSVSLRPDETIFLCVAGTNALLSPPGATIAAFFDAHSSRDGLLYLVFREESVLG